MALHRQIPVSKVHQTPQSLHDQLIDLSGVVGIELTRNIQFRLHLPDIRMYLGRLRVSHMSLRRPELRDLL